MRNKNAILGNGAADEVVGRNHIIAKNSSLLTNADPGREVDAIAMDAKFLEARCQLPQGLPLGFRQRRGIPRVRASEFTAPVEVNPRAAPYGAGVVMSRGRTVAGFQSSWHP